jgi:hypothetical protein
LGSHFRIPAAEEGDFLLQLINAYRRILLGYFVQKPDPGRVPRDPAKFGAVGLFSGRDFQQELAG